MLMRLVNAPLQTSRGNFVCGEIIQMHTMSQRNYRVMKESRNGNSKANKINKKQFNSYKLSNTINGMDAHADFCTDPPFVNSYKKTEHKGHTQYFSKRFGLQT